MALLRSLVFVLASAFALSACATPAAGSAEPAATTPPDTQKETPMTCQVEKAQWAMGKLADEALVAKAKADSTSERIRVIKPGMAVTMDYREDRLNLDVDQDNRVTAVRCG